MSRWPLFWLLIFAGAWYGWQNRPVHPAPGVLVAEDPQQSPLRAQPHLAKPGYTLRALAEFDLRGRVLSKSIYRFDTGAELMPVDLALGWGLMSDSAVLAKLNISQADRFYFWGSHDLPAAPEEISRHSANMHLIPATPELEKRIKATREGQVIHLSGYLVQATRADGLQWTSSLSRDDTGPGACEVIWVEEFAVE